MDEPEISLHPRWQENILDFYKKLFKNEAGAQTSQIFIATHSPFIIHSENRYKDKVIILKKNDEGKIIESESKEYDTPGSIEIVKEAFNINNFIATNANETKKHVIITEGKTDWKHLKNAYIAD